MHGLPVNFSQTLAFSDHAKRFLKKQYGYAVPLSVTGHSLGGMIAKLVAIKRHRKAVAFNAPGRRKLNMDQTIPPAESPLGYQQSV